MLSTNIEYWHEYLGKGANFLNSELKISSFFVKKVY